MVDMPVQRSEAAPDQTIDPVLAAQNVVDDPAKKGSPEWLAAMQLLADQGKAVQRDGFDELDKEMQALKGMSEI